MNWNSYGFAALCVGGILSCSTAPKQPLPPVDQPLDLTRVELYRNGVGYFERTGKVQGNLLTLKVRKDQINDLLKSLTIIDKNTGRPLSVTLPLDPQSWQNAAQVGFGQGGAGFVPILQSLRGTQVHLRYGHVENEQSTTGRIAMVYEQNGAMQLGLMQGPSLHLVPLDSVVSIDLADGDVALHLHRVLDAAMGEGMFQQVEVTVRLNEATDHDLLLSYVVEAPKWKPTYRLVLDSQNPNEALLQSWAVVDNTSGENWDQVHLSLTSGAPIAFRYDLHTPQNVRRPDLTENQTDRQAKVAIMNASATAKMAASAPSASQKRKPKRSEKKAELEGAGWSDNTSAVFLMEDNSTTFELEYPDVSKDDDRMFFEAMSKVNPPDVQALQVSGLSNYQLQDRVTLPNGTASMVSLISQKVEGKEFFLYNTGGAGKGYTFNPYRVVRFKNQTPFALEPGPLSIYNNGHFVGEGLTDVVGANAVSTVPFAVETGLIVESETGSRTGEKTAIKVEQGLLHYRTSDQLETIWKVRGLLDGQGYTLMVKHGKKGARYELKSQHPGIEDNPNYWLIPITVKPGADSARVSVMEEAPRTETMSLWDVQSYHLLKLHFKASTISDSLKKALLPFMAKMEELNDLSSKSNNLKSQQREYDSRLNEIRKNLDAIAKDKKATSLRDKLSKDLQEFTEKTNTLGRQIIELKDRELVLRIELKDLFKDLKIDFES